MNYLLGLWIDGARSAAGIFIVDPGLAKQDDRVLDQCFPSAQRISAALRADRSGASCEGLVMLATAH